MCLSISRLEKNLVRWFTKCCMWETCWSFQICTVDWNLNLRMFGCPVCKVRWLTYIFVFECVFYFWPGLSAMHLEIDNSQYCSSSLCTTQIFISLYMYVCTLVPRSITLTRIDWLCIFLSLSIYGKKSVKVIIVIKVLFILKCKNHFIPCQPSMQHI